jgi:hypothetical protein
MVMSSPPPEYKFQLFEIVLVPTDGVSDIRKARTSKLYQVFENITVGNYKVMVEFFNLSLCYIVTRTRCHLFFIHIFLYLLVEEIYDANMLLKRNKL